MLASCLGFPDTDGFFAYLSGSSSFIFACDLCRADAIASTAPVHTELCTVKAKLIFLSDMLCPVPPATEAVEIDFSSEDGAARASLPSHSGADWQTVGPKWKQRKSYATGCKQ